MAGEASQSGLEAVRVVREFLTEMNLAPREEPFEHGVAFHVALDGPANQGIAQVHVDIERFAFVFMFPQVVAPERRGAVAEFVVRANWGLIEGSLELNFDTGALAYKAGIDFTYAGLTNVLVRNAILSGMENVEDYAAELLEVVEGRMEAAAAARAAQGRVRDR